MLTYRYVGVQRRATRSRNISRPPVNQMVRMTIKIQRDATSVSCSCCSVDFAGRAALLLFCTVQAPMVAKLLAVCTSAVQGDTSSSLSWGDGGGKSSPSPVFSIPEDFVNPISA